MQSRRQALVVGLGQFGMALTRSLAESGVEVLVVDLLPERIQAASAFASEAACFDAMDEEALARTGPETRDLCVCTIGEEAREAAIVVTALMRQLGAKRVIARASDEILERILRLVGAHEVVNPERAFGERLARRLVYEGILEEVPLGEDLVMSELRAPAAFLAHPLRELSLPERYGRTVLGVRRRDPDGSTRLGRPGASFACREGDVLIVVGPPGASRKLMEQVGE